MVKRSQRRRKKNKEDGNPTTGAVTTAKIKSKAKTKSKSSKSNDKENTNMSTSEQKKLSFCELQMLQQTVFDFLKSDKLSEELSGLNNVQRKEIHLFARQHGLKTRSRSSAGDRLLTISRNECLQQHIRLQEVLLTVSTRTSVVLGTSLNELDRKRMQPHNEYHQGFASQGGGGLVAKPRVPPNARFNKTILAEQRQLPLQSKRSAILESLNRSQVLIVNGATGSGKSTQLPQYLLENATDRRQPIRIVVSQPRRIAAVSVASRIAEERGEVLGNAVGYIIRMESNFSSNTVLSLTTSGCLLRSLAMNGAEFFANTTHLIIDEVHDRDLNTDFLLLAVKLELQRNKSLKLILMSATMDLQALSSYFNNAPVIYVEGRSFNVRIYPLEKVLSKTGYMTPQMMRMLGNDDNADEEQLLQAYLTAHHSREEDNIDNALIVSLLQMLLLMGVKGAVIVYLPGYQDMTTLMDHLLETLPEDHIKVMLLHSQIDGLKQKEVFREYSDVQLKIVLSTNIGQTSITIPDLLYVIDTGRSKMKTYDVATGASQLACTWISQADAQQRTGRAGRCQDGICYRLYSTDQFNNFSRFVVPEMRRHTLDEICLLAKIAVPHQPIEQFLSLALDPPETTAIAQACANLKLLNVLHDSDESVTDLGRIIAELPLDVQLAKCLVYSIYYCCAGSVSIIAAFYSVRDPFVLPIDRSARNEQRKARDAFCVDSYSDSLGILLLFNEYTLVSRKGRRAVDQYCRENFVCQKSMDMFVSTVQTLRLSLRRIIKLSDLNSATKYDNNMNLVRLALTAGLYPKIVHIDRSKIGKRRLIAEGDPNVQLSRNSGMTLCFSKKPKSSLIDWLIYVEKSRTAGQVTHIEHVTLITTLMVALQCGKVAKLEPIGPQQHDNFNDDNEEADENETKSVLCLDSWIRILVDTDLGQKLLKLRSHVASEFNGFISSRVMQPDCCPSVEYVRKLLEINSEISGLSENDIILH
ncbi:3'-5' RNA helicase YTHDC2 [Drosophila innubila]|uniref:3'-5' RNA helicase YTHDC2 n=1 Tax=Drosophila innubila TaxID=198719 RepID=UPI00148CFDEB|nr:3'-5' RNA helicase YTHDC2 [Drosophila innubila]